MENWKDILGYEGIYQVSDHGNIKKLPNYIMSKQKTLKGYLSIRLNKQGIGKGFKIHRLVAIAFIPNSENKPQVNHINGNKTDNRVENLEWCTGSENIIHAVINNLKAKGEQIKSSKMSTVNILEIKNLLKGNFPCSEISERFNVSRGAISQIKNKTTWKHIIN